MSTEIKSLTPKQRNIYWDIVKGLAICLVLLGHSIQSGLTGGLCFSNWLYRFLYSFHMPLFMIVSGYFFYNSLQKYSTWEIVKKKYSTLIIPIISFGIIQFPIYFVGTYTIQNIVYYLLTSMTILWFLCQVLLCSFTVLVCNKVFHDNIWIYIVIAFTSMLIPNIMGLERYSYMIPYFVVGYLAKRQKYESYISSCNTRNLFVFFAFYILLFLFYNEKSFIYTSKTFLFSANEPLTQLWINIYRLAIGFAGSLLVLIAIGKVYYQNKNLLIFKQFANIGVASLGIYCYQTVFWHYYPLLNERIGLSSFWGILYGFIISLFTCWMLTVISSKNKFTNIIILGGR